METAFRRMASLFERRYQSFFPPDRAVSFALRTDTGLSHRFGHGAPAFAIVARSPSGIAALTTLDGSRIAEAYMRGDLDVDGDLMSVLTLRTLFSERHPFQFLWRFVQPLMFGQVESDRRWIAQHYDYPADFYLCFLDRRHRCYSQAVFAGDGEPIEDAMTRKLDFALDAVGARPGDHILDVGGGWGAMTEHAGRRGITVTSLTISRASHAFLTELIARHQLPAHVAFDHLLEHAPAKPYDAIVNLGVTEHLPNYRATLHKYLELLKPGGRIYLDASAARVKNDQTAFFVKYIYPGNGSLLCLHEYLEEVARTPFRLLGLHDDRHSYYLTTRHWAEALDRSRDEVERRWGSEVYRAFRLYLWGCAQAFDRDLAQAYRWVMQKPAGD
jgi:cyclopropane-fatty-acyl-phospholipid synthase